MLVVGAGVAVFVGVHIGASTGVAFGPAVGSGVLSKSTTAWLMLAFAPLRYWTVGRYAVGTMGGEIVPAATFSFAASAAVHGEGVGAGSPVTGTLPADQPAGVAPNGEEDSDALEQTRRDDPAQTGLVVTLWIATPTISAALSYPLFEAVLGL